jgi:hypothetical protein
MVISIKNSPKKRTGKSPFSMGKSTINGNLYKKTVPKYELENHHVFHGKTHELSMGHVPVRNVDITRGYHPQIPMT